MNPSPSPESAAARPHQRRILFACGSVLLLLLALPWLLAKTSLRDRLLTAIVNSDELTVTSRHASLGYFSPLSLAGLRIESNDKATLLEIERIESDHSWLGLLWSRPELGTFLFDRPKVDVRIDSPGDEAGDVDDSEPPQAGSIEFPVLAAEIRDASVVVRTSQSVDPPIDIERVSVTFRLERIEDRSVLRIDPATVFDHQRITPELCGHGLQLVAPLLGDALDAEGEFSLRLHEFHVPLEKAEASDPAAIRIEGELELHRASVALKDTLAKNIIGLVIRILGNSVPEKMTVAKGVKVGFQVIDGRIHHQGLALLLPRGDSSIEIVSNGSVGLDETLDLQVAIRLPPGLLGETPLAKRVSGQPIEVAIGGTLDQPQVSLPKRVDWIRSLEGLIAGKEIDPSSEPDDKSRDGALDDSLEEAVTDIVGGLLKRATQREQPIVEESILPRLRQRLRDRPLLPRRREANSEQE
jgi:hypothetical protein